MRNRHKTRILVQVWKDAPFIAIVLLAGLQGVPQDLYEAAKVDGANAIHRFWRITVPYMRPGLVAGALLAMTLSLDDFVITFFTSGPNNVTFPVKVYSMVRFSVTPEINAASTILVLVTIVLTAIAMRFQRPDKAAG